MSRSANSILAGDISVTPIKLKYSASYSDSQLTEANIVNYVGVNGPVTSTGSVAQTTLNYLSTRHLFYANYLTGSFPTSASGYDNFLQSTAAYGTLDADVRYFPTESNATIQILSIPREVYGEKIGRQSFKISSSLANIFDDGNGNLIDSTCQSYTITDTSGFTNSYSYIDCEGGSVSGTLGAFGSYTFCGISGTLSFIGGTITNNGACSTPLNVNIGNLIYAQGFAIVTNQSYSNLFSDYSVSLIAETTIYQNEVKCRVLENDFNYSQNPTMLSAVSSSAGIIANNVTGSDFKPYATTVGLYSAANELLVVGKLATPYAIPSNTDITFVIRYDS